MGRRLESGIQVGELLASPISQGNKRLNFQIILLMTLWPLSSSYLGTWGPKYLLFGHMDS